MTATTLLYFLGASIALSLAPGPDNIFVLTQGIARGRKADGASGARSLIDREQNVIRHCSSSFEWTRDVSGLRG